MTKREYRRLLKYKGCVPCQWCRRWTDTGMGHLPMQKPKGEKEGKTKTWPKWVEEHPNVHCDRPACVRYRIEVTNLVPKTAVTPAELKRITPVQNTIR